ncbi:MAG TPA: sugar transferase [Candidatus Paceibacterota bacterium]|nr:sugar transferase [Candidatus Paceibacterota bacterium]
MGNRAKTFILFLGDVIALYAGLFLALAVRYGAGFYDAFINAHAVPFTVIFVVWIVIFYIAGLYDLRRLRNNLDFIKTLWLAIATSTVLSVLVFYTIPQFGIAPKTNLIIFAVVFAALETVWRRAFNRAASTGEAPNRVLLIGNGAAEEVDRTIRENAQLGYEIRARLDESAAGKTPETIRKIVEEKDVNCIVVSRQLKREGHLPATLYQLFSQGIVVMDLPNFSELILRKVPLADLEETWFLENIEGVAQFYDPLKRAFEFLAAIIGGIILLPLELFIAVLVGVTSRGPILYRQVRVGKNGREFHLYKFRSMPALASDGSVETKGAVWATKGDARATPIGKILRASHLDELPQFINLVRGDISFVGPRPERPEFVAKLKEEIPYYETRLLVKPGVTGWAQLNHRADRSTDDVRQKLQYDIYYLKNRSLILDLAIIIKTIKSLFINPD